MFQKIKIFNKILKYNILFMLKLKRMLETEIKSFKLGCKDSMRLRI